MKVYITQTGMVDSVSTSIQDAKSALTTARNRSISCPYSFRHFNYLNGLKSKIDGFNTELTYITNTLKKSQKKYVNLFDKTITKVNRKGLTKLSVRTGVKDVL